MEKEIKMIGENLINMIEKRKHFDQAVGLLDILKDLPLTKEIMIKTKIGIIVKRLKRECTDEKARKLAKELTKKWMEKFIPKTLCHKKSISVKKNVATLCKASPEDRGSDQSTNVCAEIMNVDLTPKKEMEKEIQVIGENLMKMAEKGNHFDQAVDLLEILKDLPLTKEIVVETNIGAIVKRFKRECKDKKAQEMAKELTKIWMEKFISKKSCHEISISGEQNVATPCKASPEAKNARGSDQSIKVFASKTTNPVRINARQLLLRALASDKDDGLDLDLFASAIEDSIYKEFNDTDCKYKSRVRSRAFNLGDPKNPKLKEDFLSGIISVERIATMTSQEMACNELKEQVKLYAKESIVDYSANKAVKGSDFYKCGRCGQRNTTYTQAQTRSADEPMTTFVYCNNCGKRWKHC